MVRLLRFSIYLSTIWAVFDPCMNMAVHVSKAVISEKTITFETAEGSENT